MRTTLLIVLLTLGPAIWSSGQSTFRGLTPGRSTRPELEREIGHPVKALSATLFEYKEPEDLGRPMGVDKIFVQYRDESPSAVIERIEVLCDYPGRPQNRPDGCYGINERLKERGLKGRLYAHIVEEEKSGLTRMTNYYGPPALSVHTDRKDGERPIQSRLGLYSAELFDATVPRSCTGTFLGEWETTRGRLVLSDLPGNLERNREKPNTKGTYSSGNGTLTAFEGAFLTGEWTDVTGTGTFELKFNWNDPFKIAPHEVRKTFTGTWKRTTGKGPKKGTWEGRCVLSS